MSVAPTLPELFFDHPTKHWHFEELLKTVGLSRGQTNFWIRKLKKEGLISRIKPKKKMPYYLANYQSPHYQNSKKIFALKKLHEAGLLDYLSSLEKAKLVVLFGSFSRWDWHAESDIDLFVYGEIDQLDLGPHHQKLHREIQIFSGKNEEDLARYGPALLKNVLKGMKIKGDFPQEMIRYALV